MVNGVLKLECKLKGGCNAWGNVLTETNPHKLSQLIRLPGQQYDEETGLYYNRHRYYDPQLGRYITQDPIGLRGGWNAYGYPLDPVIYMDPEGLDKRIFDTKDSAAIQALRACNGKSITENREFGGLICKNKSNKYYSTDAIKGGKSGVNPFKSPCAGDAEVVGDYHTHGFYNDIDGNYATKENDVWNSDDFSKADISGANLLGRKHSNYNIYLDTPANTIKKYTPKTGFVEVLE
ncbi:RHS repeat-associated core domain-containing protein [Scandinavium sp. NPDC088450]|uniref:RHS repeat-associated core domain-containing protein n=1 Tax=Scandinavium sp. NPDC088450 TaxID=3364514 RepID=UPI00384D4FF5